MSPEGLVATVQNRDMTSRSRIAAVLFAAIATLALGGCGGDKATLATFVGVWQAHARTLKITRTGNADEWLSLGLGHFVIALRFHLSRPRGTPDDATATATVRPFASGRGAPSRAGIHHHAWASPGGFASETVSLPRR
jgi:hypothetical protein